mgnify:CR=1 FL=1
MPRWTSQRLPELLVENYLTVRARSASRRTGYLALSVEETGDTEQKQMGDVMKALMPKVAGRADGKRVSAAVRRWKASNATTNGSNAST